MYNERAESMKLMTAQAQESARAIVEIASKPVMSLSEDLYGGVSGYSNPLLYANHTRAKTLSRKALWESPAAQALNGRFVDMVHGPALELQSMPMWELIPGGPVDKTTLGCSNIAHGNNYFFYLVGYFHFTPNFVTC
jgi:hypothetical protein